MKNILLALFATFINLASSQVPVSIWGSNVNVRACTNTSCDVVGQIANPSNASVFCQEPGESITAEGTTNNFWANLTNIDGDIPDGFVSNIYIKGGAILAGVPLCSQNTSDVSVWATDVNVRLCPNTSCEALGQIADPSTVKAICQDTGEEVTEEGTTNDYWTNILSPSDGAPGGWISNIYIKGDAVIKGVAKCNKGASDNGGGEGGSTSLTEEDLGQMMPNADSSKLQEYFPDLNSAMAEGEINTCPRMSAFLAQLAEESGELKYMEEIASGAEYEGRCSDLGNCSPGDGKKYKGRGPIQLTGKANYERAGKDLELDLVGNPELAAEPENAFRIAVWFWNGRNLNDLADKNDQDSFDQITLKINGCITCSSTHNDVRTDYWKKNKAILGC